FNRYIRYILRESIPDALIEKPTAILFENWGRPPFYAGWHAWKPNCSPHRIRQAIVRPFLGHNIFICGEAFSSEQGWVEGALRSAECVLRKLGVKPPNGVDPPKGFETFDEYVAW